MRVKIRVKGNTNKTKKFLTKAQRSKELFRNILTYYGQKGVIALRSATPVNTGTTADCWGFDIIEEAGETKIVWTNNNVVKGVQIALILQYGHGTRNGGYVVGRDYINPAIQPIFDEMAENLWKEVTS